MKLDDSLSGADHYCAVVIESRGFQPPDGCGNAIKS